MNTEYIKSYKDKELRQYVVAYLLISIASVGFHTRIDDGGIILLSSLFKMASIDVFVGAICALVFVFNELWSDKAKTKIVYGQMPSDTVFSNIAAGKIDATGFDLEKAKIMYNDLSTATANIQTAEWGLLLRKSRNAGQGNVIEAERLQLMTRDICMTTVSLMIMTVIALIMLTVVDANICVSLKMLSFPLAYLFVMLFVSRAAARSRAFRLVAIVIKNDVQSNSDVLLTKHEEDNPVVIH